MLKTIGDRAILVTLDAQNQKRRENELEGPVVIEMNDGRVLERHVPHALGTLEHPMSDADLEAKFRGLASGILPNAKLNGLITGCWGVANLKDAG